MAIIKNDLTYGYAFNITAAGPVDSRMRVNYISDLTTVWGTYADGKFTANNEMNIYAGMMVVVNDQNKAYILKQQIADGYNIDATKEIVKNGLVYDKSTDNPIPANPTNINNWVPVGTDFSGDIASLDGRIDHLETFKTAVDTKLNISDNSALGFDANGALKVKIAEDANGFINGLERDSDGALKVATYNLVAKTANVDESYAAQYEFKVNGNTVTTINIPKDQVLKNAEILSVTEENLPYTGAKVGDKYIKFEFQNNTTPQYLAVQDLVDVYTADETYINMSESNVITLNVSAVADKIDELLNINATAATVTGLNTILVGADGNSGLVADVAKNTRDISTNATNIETLTRNIGTINDNITTINQNVNGLAAFDTVLKTEGIVNRVSNDASYGIKLTSEEVGDNGAVVAKINVDIDTLASAVIDAADIPAPIAENIAVSAFGATYTENTNVQAVLESLDSRIKAAVSGGVTSVVAGVGINVNAKDANNPTVSVKTSDLVVSGSALTVTDNKIDICWSEL